MITKEILKKELEYNKETGIFTRIKTGEIAGSKLRYVKIHLKGKNYSAHRLAWLYVYDYIPDYSKDLMIDHINQNKHDNRICNLRVVNRSQNAQNSKLYSKNKTGIKGVHWIKEDKSYRATIYLNNKQISLGSHKNLFDAICARKSMENKIFI
jgi:hypothetical protein